jgi:hypothetical protein
MSRPAPPIPPDRSSGTAAAKLPRMGPSEEGKQRLSELAKARHRAGGFKKAPGRSKKPRGQSRQRIATMVAEAARETKSANQIIDVFKDAIQPTQPMHVRLKAAETWLRVEHEDAKLQIREAATASEKKDRAELLDLLSKKLTSGHSAFLLQKQLKANLNGDVVEGHIVSDSDQSIH